jgi:hypothetical protein
MATCRICSQPAVREWLDFGPQTLTNRFLATNAEAEFTHPCKIGACRHCGAVQLESPVPVDEMRPKFDWIVYNEPESHLDAVADQIAKLSGLSPAAAIGGITYKDESTLKRLNARGFPNTWLAHIRDDLGVESNLGGIESVQDKLTTATAERLANKYGRPDVLLVRHVLEHSYDIHQTLRTARAVVKPGGYVMFEMPDCRKAFDRLDYTTVWEEHLFYFTPVTLRQCFAAAGFEVVSLNSYYYSQENVLVAIVRPAEKPYALPAGADDLKDELARSDRFVREFPATRHRIQTQLKTFAKTRGKVAMLGAGHLSGACINLYGLDEIVDFVADDNAKKHGLFMPGSKAPVLPSSQLVARDIKLCLMTVRAEIEEVVVRKNQAFTDRGGHLVSIFPDSRYALEKFSTAIHKAA